MVLENMIIHDHIQRYCNLPRFDYTGRWSQLRQFAPASWCQDGDDRVDGDLPWGKLHGRTAREFCHAFVSSIPVACKSHPGTSAYIISSAFKLLVSTSVFLEICLVSKWMFLLWVLLHEVYKIAWWMCHYGSGSPKRHLGMTNNAWCDKLNKGKLSKAVREQCEVQTVVRYISKSGRPSYKGTSALKSTQPRS